MEGLVDIEQSGNVPIFQRVKREGGKLYHQTTFHDDKTLAHNRRLADSGFLDKSELGLHDDADIRMVISCPSVEQWTLFKDQNPEVYKLLTSTNEHERIKGARQISLLKPEWIIHTRL